MKRSLLSLAALALFAACSDNAGPGMQPGVGLSFSTRASGAQPAPGFFASVMSDTLTNSGDTLIITKAEIVLRQVELKRVETVDCNSDVGDDDCEEFETGPMLVDLPLNGEVQQAVAIQPPPGTYDEVEFEIHKVTTDAEDAAFAALHPDLVGISIRVQGTFNGQPFTFETDLDVEQEFDLPTPIEVIDASTATNVTILLDLSQWFVDNAGTLVDPETGNVGGANESLVKENIKQSIEAFEDHDGDGHESHDD